jgi:uncharacterized membrane protein YbhN (UPF0104 family)
MAAETVFNAAAAGALVGWALARGAFPIPELDASTAVAVGIAALALGAVVLRCRGRFWSSFGTGFRVFADPVAYLRDVAVWQALDWILRLATIYWFMVAFGIDGGFEALLLIQGAQSASALLPLTPARIGTKQAVLVYVLGTQASTASLFAFVAGTELLLAGTNAALGIGAMLADLGTLRWRAVLAPRVAPAEP